MPKDLILSTLCGYTLLFVLHQWNARRSSPLLAITSRWLLWLLSSLTIAMTVQHYGWLPHPLWALFGMAALVWFLGESMYMWIAIHALSVSEMPLFPRFTLNTSGDEWPTHPRFLKLRDELRSAGFRPVQALRAEVMEGHYLRLSIYQNADHTVRAQVTFLPQGNGGISVCLAFSTETEDGRRIVTDNLYLPYGGFYPEHWEVVRMPWIRSWTRLLKQHEGRVQAAGAPVTPWHSDPLQDVNAQQRELDQINTEMGFLMPPADREELGKMTHEGRYRVWKEVWMLNYLGRSVRYD